MDKLDYPAIGGGMIVEHEHWAVANLLIGRYGRQAADQAAVRAEDADAKGDREGRDIWQSVEGVLSRHNIHAGQYD
jgi:hypothetical protein